jgi:formyltetrahydrofolate synthetase
LSTSNSEGIGFKNFNYFYSSSSKCKTEIEKIVEIFGGGVKKKSSKIIEETLSIPQLQMNSNEHVCSAIQVSYGIEVEAELSGSHKNLTVFIPIKIGSRSLSFKRSINAILSPTAVNHIRKPSAPNDRKCLIN